MSGYYDNETLSHMQFQKLGQVLVVQCFLPGAACNLDGQIFFYFMF